MKRIAKYSLGVFACLLTLNLAAQRASLIADAGDEYFERAQYIKAISFYKSSLEVDEDYARAQYQLAECYRLTFDYNSAEYYYELLAKRKNPKYPLASYYYPLMLKLAGRYTEALVGFRDFEKFLKENNFHEQPEYRYFHKQAKVEIDGCQLALNQVKMVHPDHQFTVLGAPINTVYNDYAAFSLGKDSLICITSAREEGKGSLKDLQFGETQADLFRFVGSGGEWNKYDPKDRFESVVNSKWGDGSGSFNIDRTKFYYTNCEVSVGEVCHIYFSTLTGGKWSDPQPLNANINSDDFSSKHPSLTPRGDTLFFVSDREGGLGGLDIWMSLNAGGQSWGPPINLGEQINTRFNEVSPYYDENDNVLYFASEGHRGFGGYDIYVAKGRSFASADIYNAGIPFNSNKDELFFFLGNKIGYLTSNRDGGIGKFDIYAYNIKSKQDLLSEVASTETLAGRNSLFTDDYNFDSRETETINQIISRQLAAAFTLADPLYTTEQLEVFESLSLDDQDRIDKIVKARLRKMTQNMLRSIRSEDDYYYQQLTTDRRRVVDNIITAHIEQKNLGLGVQLNQEGSTFYESELPDDQEKLDILILDQISQSNNFTPKLVNYESLSEVNQQNLDGIASKYIQQKRGFNNIALSINERQWLLKADESEKRKVNLALRERLLLLHKEDRYRLREADRSFYENLSDDHKENLRTLASIFLTANFTTFEEEVDPSQLKFYDIFNQTQDATLDKLLVMQMSNMAAADLYRIERIFSRDELREAGSNADEIYENLLALKKDLNDDEKAALKRFASSLYDVYMQEPSPIYPLERQEVQVLADQQPFSGSISPKDKEDLVLQLPKDALSEYESLNDEHKVMVNKLVGLDYINQAYKDKTLKASDEAEELALPLDQKRHVEVLARNFDGSLTGQEAPSIDAFTFYNNLADLRKALFNRLTLRNVFREVPGGYRISSDDRALSYTVRNSHPYLIESLKKFRFGNERIMSEKMPVETKDVDEAPIDAIAFVKPESEPEVESKEAELEQTEVSMGLVAATSGDEIKPAGAGDNESIEQPSTPATDETLSVANDGDNTIVANASDVEASGTSQETTGSKVGTPPSIAQQTEGDAETGENEETLASADAENVSNNIPESENTLIADENNPDSNSDGGVAGTTIQEAETSTDKSGESTSASNTSMAEANESLANRRDEEITASDLSNSPKELLSAKSASSVTTPEATAYKADVTTYKGSELPIQFVQVGSDDTGFITISGRLVDPINKQPVANQQVVLQESGKDETTTNGYTDEKGYFTFEVPNGVYEVDMAQTGASREAVALTDLKANRVSRSRERSGQTLVRAYFATGDFKHKGGGFSLLDQIVDEYKKSPFSIEIEAHADNIGRDSFNQELSKNRGYSTSEYLIAQGVKKSDLSIIWHGSSKPISDNNNPYGRQLNRRVDIRVGVSNISKFGQNYIVRPGVSLGQIAKAFNVSVEQIMQWNRMRSQVISAYETVRIGKENIPTPDLNLVVPENLSFGNSFTYLVPAGGESLAAISARFNVPEELIAELNDLQGSFVSEGTRLQIYP